MINLKQNRAFTLVEILAVITLIALLSLVALPLVINQVNKSKGKIDDTLQVLIEEATDRYIDMNQAKYPKQEGAKYCISLQTLVDYEYLKEPLINPSDKKKVNLSLIVQANFISDTEATYSIVEYCVKGKSE